MARSEQQPTYKAFTNSAVGLPKGVLGKTADALIGCMVPVVLYDTSAILGHFGPASYEEMQRKLKQYIDGRKNPSEVLIFHLHLMHSVSGGYDELYEGWLGRMKNAVAQTVRIPAEHIELRTYEMNSEVIVDWRAPDHPLIYAQPISLFKDEG